MDQIQLRDNELTKQLSPQTAKVAKYIGELIRNGSIKPGQRFPAERTLADETKVSRHTVRSAIEYFETLGMVKTVIGSGSYLVEDRDTVYRIFGSRQLLVPYNVTDMLEARRVLESGIVQLAALRATREDKLRLLQLCDELEKISLTVSTEAGMESFGKADYSLHREFARLSRNEILLELFEALRDTFLYAHRAVKYDEGFQSANKFHRAITNAIIAGDGAEAVRQVEGHLESMEKMLEKIQREKDSPDSPGPLNADQAL